MRAGKTCGRIVTVGALLVAVSPLASDPVIASPRNGYPRSHRYVQTRLQCVPFARKESGIELIGNAWTWWKQAAGVYQRGPAPEAGAVLAFRANSTMRLGHVAVV